MNWNGSARTTTFKSSTKLTATINSADVATAGVPVIVLTSAILDPGERSLLHRASRIVSKSDLSAGMLIDAIEDALHRARPVAAE